jgi:phosphoribosylformylglycinamidine synthase
MSLNFKNEGDAIVLIGEPKNDIGSSQYLAKVKGVALSNCPYFNLDTEFQLHQMLEKLSHNQLAASVHDISEGGLFVACLESAMQGNLGFDICTDQNFRNDAWLFGESQSRVVVSVPQNKLDQLKALAAEFSLPITQIGTVTSGEIGLNGQAFVNVAKIADIYNNAIGNKMTA